MYPLLMIVGTMPFNLEDLLNTEETLGLSDLISLYAALVNPQCHFDLARESDFVLELMRGELKELIADRLG
jgi:hypothetical protein